MAGDSADWERQHLVALGCGSCHTIPGIIGRSWQVGPSLEGIANPIA